MKKFRYITVNKFFGKISKRGSNDYELACARCEKGGYVLINNKNLPMKLRKTFIK